ncbi:MAG: glutamine amidotransferase [Candidatus Nomurabacteria bacterium]|jgi:CobQ-like glutamine amidotransferase family enzyme|nr:glutamine amidotransferase [Candidatus Nomurabacteria bacterium]
MSRRTLKILHLYPREMNLYGDHGNVLTLMRRCKWRGIEAEVVVYEPGGKLPHGVDIVFGGGGQDSGQSTIQNDLLKIGPDLNKLVESDTPTLVICGLYQVFGKFFKTIGGETINGIGVFDMETFGGAERLIGNITCSSAEFGEIVGYENHSGQTFLGKGVQPLAKVIRGAGNNGQDGTEGARYKNAIGSYLHGPVLPKNPKLADFLIAKALQNKYDDDTLSPLDDSAEQLAHESSASRPR